MNLKLMIIPFAPLILALILGLIIMIIVLIMTREGKVKKMTREGKIILIKAIIALTMTGFMLWLFKTLNMQEGDIVVVVLYTLLISFVSMIYGGLNR